MNEAEKRLAKLSDEIDEYARGVIRTRLELSDPNAGTDTMRLMVELELIGKRKKEKEDQ